MPICSKCSETKPIENFAKGKNNGCHRWCRGCMREYASKRHQNKSALEKAKIKEARDTLKVSNRKFIWEYLQEHPCVDCGENDPVVLHFDHQGEKEANVSRLVGFNRDRIEREIARCSVRCGNCHVLKTAREGAHYTWLPEETHNQYLIHGSRYGKCPEAKILPPSGKRILNYRRNRIHIFEYLTKNPCRGCGIANPVMLQFDHLRDKFRDIARMHGYKLERIQKEIVKCQVLCVNCHARKTAKELNHYAWVDKESLL